MIGLYSIIKNYFACVHHTCITVSVLYAVNIVIMYNVSIVSMIISVFVASMQSMCRVLTKIKDLKGVSPFDNQTMDALAHLVVTNSSPSTGNLCRSI